MRQGERFYYFLSAIEFRYCKPNKGSQHVTDIMNIKIILFLKLPVRENYRVFGLPNKFGMQTYTDIPSQVRTDFYVFSGLHTLANEFPHC